MQQQAKEERPADKGQQNAHRKFKRSKQAACQHITQHNKSRPQQHGRGQQNAMVIAHQPPGNVRSQQPHKAEQPCKADSCPRQQRRRQNAQKV